MTPLAAPALPAATATPHSMAACYAQRAASYERVYRKPERQTDLRAMAAWLATRFGGRSVLELACGTGWWTPHGAAAASHWRATDLTPKTLAVAQAKPAMPVVVRFQQVDAYTLHARLRPGAEVVMLDNRLVAGSSTPISHHDVQGNTYQQRTLDDGSVHEVLKNFPAADAAIAALGPRARDPQWITWPHYLPHYWPHYRALTWTVA